MRSRQLSPISTSIVSYQCSNPPELDVELASFFTEAGQPPPPGGYAWFCRVPGARPDFRAFYSAVFDRVEETTPGEYVPVRVAAAISEALSHLGSR
ncbi:DUF5956 family protein [Actinokineospora sp. NBRC 105648]|uniref:DUF5956 family protein n=1 Tax=Actinokineospora sp. NBRC 105648 TaxID=3032206 RepID=UPI0033261189